MPEEEDTLTTCEWKNMGKEILQTTHTQFAENQRDREQGFIKTLPLLGAVIFAYAYVFYTHNQSPISISMEDFKYVHYAAVGLLFFGVWMTAILSSNFRRDQELCDRIRRKAQLGWLFGNYTAKKGFISWMPDFYRTFALLLISTQVLLWWFYLKQTLSPCFWKTLVTGISPNLGVYLWYWRKTWCKLQESTPETTE